MTLRRLWVLGRYVWALPNTIIGLLIVPAALLPRGRTQIVDGVLEAHGPLIAAVLRHCVPLGGGAAAITLGHVVLARDGGTMDATRAHERVHVRQCEIWGPAFIPAYLVAGLWAMLTGAGAYAGNYFERQATELSFVSGPVTGPATGDGNDCSARARQRRQGDARLAR
jgi:hypothetical protein